MPQAYHDPAFLKESWGLFGIGALILVLRTFVRLRSVGLRNLAGDDYITLAVLVCYLGDAITVTYCYEYGTNLDFTQEQFAHMTADELHQVSIGSRMQLLAWYSYTGLIWALKTCMLFFLYRLTTGLPLQKYVRWLSWATGISYLVVFLTISCGCYPIQKNWQVLPNPGEQCTFRPQNFYSTTIMNVLTDAAIMIVPLPLLAKLQVTWTKKFGLALLLFPGVFVITAAMIRVVMSLSAHPSALNVNRWGVRETIAGIVAVNLPILRPLFSKSFWRPGYERQQSSEPRSYSKKSSKLRAADHSSVYELSYSSQRPSSMSTKNQWGTATAVLKELASRASIDNVRGDASSEEYIIRKDIPLQEGSRELDEDVERGPTGVIVSTTFESDSQSRYLPSAGGEAARVDPWEMRKKGHGNNVVISSGSRT